MYKTPSLNKKINMHAYIIKHAQNCMKFVQNGAITNGTPQKATEMKLIDVYCIVATTHRTNITK